MLSYDDLAKHKEIYLRLLNEIDKDIYRRIVENPDGPEAQHLNRRVEILLKDLPKN